LDLEPMLEGLARSREALPFRELVGRVEAYDREHGSDLMRTLRAYFAANANASRAADMLYLHRNSVPYRLARIEKLTGLDLRDHRAKLALQIGLLAVAAERSDRGEAERP
jgi:DNA-binding PucR family transcriptional regulator